MSRLMISSSPVVFLPAGFDPLLAPEADAFLDVLGGMMTSLLSSSLLLLSLLLLSLASSLALSLSPAPFASPYLSVKG